MKFIKSLVHHLRLTFLPSGRGRLWGFGPGGWQVVYPSSEFDPKGGVSCEMSYDVACDYAEMFGGTVRKYQVPTKHNET